MEIGYKIILDTRYQKKNLTYPLKMRVYQDRCYKTYSLGIDLRENDWNDQLQQVTKANPNHRLYNVKINDLKVKAQKSIFLNDDEEKAISPDELIGQITRKSQKKMVVVKPDILQYGKQHIAKLESAGQVGNSIVYNTAINKLRKFAKSDNLTFEDVSYSFIERFNTALLVEGMKVNGISNYMRTIRALFNKAIMEGIISADCYPFSKFKIKNERTINRTITVPEITKIAEMNLIPQTAMWHHRNLFLLSYCLIGINFSDLLTLTNDCFVDGRVVFRRKKTHKVYSIQIQPKTQEILNHYVLSVTDTKSYVLPFVVNLNNPFQLKKDITQAIKNTNNYLRMMATECSIGKCITTYYARYGWANAARSLGYSKDLIAEALGHEYGNKVTGIYLDNYGNDIIDEMNAKVVSSTFFI